MSPGRLDIFSDDKFMAEQVAAADPNSVPVFPRQQSNLENSRVTEGAHLPGIVPPFYFPVVAGFALQRFAAIFHIYGFIRLYFLTIPNIAFIIKQKFRSTGN